MAYVNVFILICLWTVLAITAQKPVNIGKFRSYAHGVKSGRVELLDDKTIKIQDFHYEGDGPDTWFLVGRDTKYTQERPRGGLPFTDIVPDENGSCVKPRKYTGETIELTLPGNVTTSDVSYLAVYCITFNHNFGYIPIPRGRRAASSKHAGPTKRCPRPASAKKRKPSSTAKTSTSRTTANRNGSKATTTRRAIRE